jgi:cytochrome c oxidase subunit 2
MMAPMAAILDDQGVKNVMAYLATLPDEPAPPTVSGNASHGESLYTTCAAVTASRARASGRPMRPRLSHMSDWYMVEQLQNFRKGIRGTHPQDYPGAQMERMARTLAPDRATNDLFAYINTMK